MTGIGSLSSEVVCVSTDPIAADTSRSRRGSRRPATRSGFDRPVSAPRARCVRLSPSETRRGEPPEPSGGRGHSSGYPTEARPIVAVEPLISESEIQDRLAALGRQIEADYQGKPLTIVAVLTGSLILLADLIRQIQHPAAGRPAAGEQLQGGDDDRRRPWSINEAFAPDVAGRDVLLLDDILDTGHTLATLVRRMSDRGARQRPDRRPAPQGRPPGGPPSSPTTAASPSPTPSSSATASTTTTTTATCPTSPCSTRQQAGGAAIGPDGPP